jgi:hypothetical protein
MIHPLFWLALCNAETQKRVTKAGDGHGNVAFHADIQRGNTKRGQTMTTYEPFEFAKYKRPQFEGPIHKRAGAAESDDGPENLSDLLGRVSENSTGEIDSLLASLNGCGEGYRPTAIAFNARLRNITH